ncbi:MAG: hypothetical protein HYX67_10365 [Candidatus Melainabacteria bacterium]|nr:hypothetical protein [Candidatus Melainabacteria bacterium]
MSCSTSFTLVRPRKEQEHPYQLSCEKALELLKKFNLSSQEEYLKTVSIEKKWPQPSSNQSYKFLSPQRFQCLLEGVNNAPIEKKWPQLSNNQSYEFLSPQRFQCLLEGVNNAPNESEYKKCTQTCLSKFGGRIKLSPKDSNTCD